MKISKQDIDHAREIIRVSENIVFFGGAGVSTASGIPDFRSATGLYNQRTGSRYDPETMLSHEFLIHHSGEFWDYHLHNLMPTGIEPNPAHYALANLEQQGKLKAIVTQNIDGLHQKAGSRNVIELHGNTQNFYCMACGNRVSLDFVQNAISLPPHCPICGGVIRPDVILYGEPLIQRVITAAINAIRSADLLVVGGTSLVVYPAARMIDFFRGDNLILINKENTGFDTRADLVLTGDIAKILPLLVD